MQCPVCGEIMTAEQDDFRHEWERITYRCHLCDRDFTRIIRFKTQSSMVESDTWEDFDEKELEKDA